MGASNQDLVITLMIRFCNTTSLFKVVLSFKMAADLSNLNEIGNPSNPCYVSGIRQYWDACVTTLL